MAIEFSKTGSGNPRSKCRPCTTKENLARYHASATTREAHRNASRKHGLKKYGITLSDFDKMYADQGGACAICAVPIAHTSEDRHMSSAVDHCHTTLKVRGLLCFHCNVGLGKFFDNPELMRRAAAYIETNK